MIDILPLTEAEFEAAGIVLDAAYEGHNLIRSLRNNSVFQPSGWFYARLDSELVGTVGAIDYGSFASIGLVAMHPKAQRRGIGQQLIGHMLDWLDERGCPVSFLDATAMGAPLYEKLGFVDDGRTFRFDRTDHTPLLSMPDLIQTMTNADIADVIAFDAPIFGAARAAIIPHFYECDPSRAFVARDKTGVIEGFLIAQPLVLGPWSARTPQAAEQLLQAALTLTYDEHEPSPRVLFPAANLEAVSLLRRYGFTQSRDLRHMRRGGQADPRDCHQLFGQTNFMLG